MPEYRIISGAHDITMTRPSRKACLRSLQLSHLVKASPVIEVKKVSTGISKYYITSELIEALKLYENCTTPHKEIQNGQIVDED